MQGATGKHQRGAVVRPQRVIGVLAILVIVLLMAVDCTSSATDGALSRSSGTGTAQALEQDFTRVVHATLPSIVEIVSPRGLGSGVSFDDKGDIVTNAHVVGKSATFKVRTSTGTQQFPATLVGSYPPGWHCCDPDPGRATSQAGEVRPLIHGRSGRHRARHGQPVRPGCHHH